MEERREGVTALPRFGGGPLIGLRRLVVDELKVVHELLNHLPDRIKRCLPV